MRERRNYYRLLHLQPDAPIELVRVNFRTLMQKLGAHPDLGGEHATAVELTAAYRTLSHPQRRAEYDEELLARYDIATLSLGTAQAPRGSSRSAGPRGVNQRNFYRILQVQKEAPFPVLAASYRTLRACEPDDAPLLDEAFSLLSNEARRREYDGLLGEHGHLEAMKRLRKPAAPERRELAYRPRITTYCAFCKAPFAESRTPDTSTCCTDCDSPLHTPPETLLALARREVGRVERDDDVSLYLGWPGPIATAQLQDLSPTGMRCSTPAPLDPGDVLKIDSRGFDAVGAVAYRERADDTTVAGFRFLTVRFPDARGNFVSTRA